MPFSRFHVLYADMLRDLEEPLRDLPLIEQWENSEGLLSLTRRLSSLGKAVDSGLILGRFPAVPGIRNSGNLPIFLRTLFKRVFGRDGMVLPDALSKDVHSLRQLTQCLGKISLPRIDSDSDIWNSFKARQDALASYRVPRENLVLIRLRQLAHHHLGELTLSDITPGHGPGNVAESLLRDERYTFKRWFSPAQNVYPQECFGRLLHGSSSNIGSVRPRDSTTRVCVVPKDFKKGRLISIEPASQQFLQQGQMRLLYEFLSTSPIRRFCSVTDQTRSHSFLHDLSFQTIDLSDASDRISAALIWFLFPKRLRNQLFATRSLFAEYGGERVRMYTFAPMGSAICFPVQTIVFTLAVMAVWDVVFPEDKLRNLKCMVYGDDIIVPDSIVPLLLTTLDAMGLKVNSEKSCLGATPFRESCGLETWKGSPVSVFRFRDYLLDQPSRGNVFKLLQTQRSAHLYGLPRVAETLFQWAREVFPVPRTSVRDSPSGFALGPTHFHGCAWQYNLDYQRNEVLVPSVHQRSRKWRADQSTILFARLIGDSSDRVVSRGLIDRYTWTSALEKS